MMRLLRAIVGPRAIGVATLTLTVSALLVAAACLPDLRAFPPPPDAASEPGASPLLPACGDGVIETLDDGGDAGDAGESCDPADAAVSGCKECRLTCGGTLDRGHCYFWTDSTDSYVAATAACQAADGHVVTFASEDEARFVATLAGNATFWVGLSVTPAYGGYAPKDLSEPGWPTSNTVCPGCFALGADAGTFAPSPEDAGDDPRLCLVSENSVWLRAPCEGTAKRATLCEREPIGQRIYPCGGLFCTTLDVSAGHKRYVVAQFFATADEAKRFCEDTYDGGKLVMLDTREEREQLVREISQVLTPTATPAEKLLDVWIGLSLVDGRWTWDDGVIAEADGARAPPWAASQPTGGGRAFLRINDKFDTQLARGQDVPDAGTKLPFVCQRPIE